MERKHGSHAPAPRAGRRPRAGAPEPAHRPAPVDMGAESVAGEEDPGAGIDTTLQSAACRPDGIDPASGLPGDGCLAQPSGEDDTRQDFEPLDRGRIHLLDPLEVQYWCRELGCSEAELHDAVGRVGAHVAAVREALRRPRR
ncbi:DUF3606 domain-containing protein [Caldimonas thermodepolymerans]|uniref:DUF3606 domain-containing protein n=1 Tax=Caldimonas thermodepolymerans TaxID=215580 RepID=UPI002236998D|nr:DUF3606 domain-containing protein [Caldimonas thermodepolymerans]UZG44869.1 DUF3606 domain-containing protein [Caldimonas thermodepolymerans]